MGLVSAEAYHLQICIHIILVCAMVDNISVVPAIAAKEGYYRPMREQR